MTMIRSYQDLVPDQPNGYHLVYLLGYGGRIWHSRRQLKLLRDKGYSILAIDFEDVLKNRDPQDLITVMDEVETMLEARRLLVKRTIIMGVSMGGLVGFNMIKRHKELDKLLVITGGNMALIPQSYRQKWPVSYKELARLWADVNIYTKPGQVKGKYITMVLPSRDKMVDPEEVADELEMLSRHNTIRVVKVKGGHFRTIITETILRPKRSLAIIREMSNR